MSARPFVWPTIAVVSVIAVGVVVLGDVESAVRPVLVVSFLLVVPGLTAVRLLRLGDRAAELSLGVALSVTLALLVAAGWIYTGAWSPKHGLVFLMAVTLGAVLAELATERRRSPRGRP